MTVLGRRNMTLEKDPETGKNLKELIQELRATISENDTEERYEQINEIKKCLSRILGIDLTNINLYKANLDTLHFEHASCNSAHFEHASCNDAHFEHASCYFAHFEYAWCDTAHFEYATCYNTHFEYATCYNTHFEEVKYLSAEQLSKVDTIIGASGLSDEMKNEIILFNPKLKEQLFPSSNDEPDIGFPHQNI